LPSRLCMATSVKKRRAWVHGTEHAWVAHSCAKSYSLFAIIVNSPGSFLLSKFRCSIPPA